MTFVVAKLFPFISYELKVRLANSFCLFHGAGIMRGMKNAWVHPTAFEFDLGN